VVIDTLRADHTSAYGHERRTTPQLEALAAAGIRFADVTSPASWTWPGHASLFTGVTPDVHGAHHAAGGTEHSGSSKHVAGIDPSLPTVAERFAEAGYRTVAAYANQLLRPDYGLTRGFGEVFGGTDEEVVAAARSAMVSPEPLFLFVNLMAPHTPYREQPAPWWTAQDADWIRGVGTPGALENLLVPGPPPAVQPAAIPMLGAAGRNPETGQVAELTPEHLAWIEKVYDGEVLRADVDLNALLTAWTASHPEGIVAVTSDHAEYFGERGLLNHHSTVYDPVLRVPLVLAWPGELEAGSVVETAVGSHQIAPTLVELAGLGRTEGSLVPVLDGADNGPIKAQAWVDAYRSAHYSGAFGVGWKLYREGDLALVLGDDGTLQLFDLATDRDMLLDRAADRPEDVARLAAAASDAFVADGETVAVEVEEALRALGYIE